MKREEMSGSTYIRAPLENTDAGEHWFKQTETQGFRDCLEQASKEALHAILAAAANSTDPKVSKAYGRWDAIQATLAAIERTGSNGK